MVEQGLFTLINPLGTLEIGYGFLAFHGWIETLW